VKQCSFRVVRGGSSGPCWDHNPRARGRTAGACQRVGVHVPKPHRQPYEFDGLPANLPQESHTHLFFNRLILPSRPNLTNTAKLPQTKVTVQTYHSVYVYTARRLWIAYALAASSAIVAVAIGLYTIVSTGTSYSNEFSTILRVSRHAHLDHEGSQGAADGRDPLSKYLAKATLTVVKQDETDSSLAERRSTATASYQLLSPGDERSFDMRGSR
jgi:hypothetical protein